MMVSLKTFECSVQTVIFYMFCGCLSPWMLTPWLLRASCIFIFITRDFHSTLGGKWAKVERQAHLNWQNPQLLGQGTEPREGISSTSALQRQEDGELGSQLCKLGVGTLNLFCLTRTLGGMGLIFMLLERSSMRVVASPELTLAVCQMWVQVLMVSPPKWPCRKPCSNCGPAILNPYRL